MRMTFTKCCRGDFDKSSVFLKLLHVVASAVTHTGTDTADHLEYGVLDISLVSYTTFDAFRNQFLCIGLEVTVLAAVLHRGNGSHTTIYLVFSSLI